MSVSTTGREVVAVALAGRVHSDALGRGPVELVLQTVGRRRRRERAELALLGGGVARLGGGEGRRELRDEVLVEVVDDDEALGGVAGLAGVVEACRCGILDHLVEVVGAEQHERVGSAELEHDLLEVAAGDLGDGGTGALRSGERDALHAAVADDGLDLLVGGVDVDVGALGEAGIREDLLDGRGRLRALRGVLQQDGVADDEVGAGEAGHLVVREVPRHDAEQHAERAATDDGAALSGEQLDRLVGEHVGGDVGVVAVDVGGEVDLAEGLLDGLAHLAHDDLRELLAALGVQLAHPTDEGRAIGGAGGARPAGVSGIRGRRSRPSGPHR